MTPVVIGKIFSSHLSMVLNAVLVCKIMNVATYPAKKYVFASFLGYTSHLQINPRDNSILDTHPMVFYHFYPLASFCPSLMQWTDGQRRRCKNVFIFVILVTFFYVLLTFFRTFFKIKKPLKICF